MTLMPSGSDRLPLDFGRYVLEQRVGKGGMAWVYLGRQKPPVEKRVAIKVLFPHLAEDPDFIERFRREAKTGASMQHPNIVQVFEYGEHEHGPYIVMEYVDGWDLRTWLEEHGPLPLEPALFILRDICLALEHAHAPGRDIIHRDIKPSNVMLTRDGQVKLMDFGLARAQVEDSHMTRTGQVMGTVHYMSPEQSRGERLDVPGGKLSDIFSAGVVCYELLTGIRPFDGQDMSAVFEQLRSNEPARVDVVNPLVPPSLAAIIRNMLDKDPHRRCPDIGRVIADLDAAIEATGVTGARTLLRDYVNDPARMAVALRERATEGRRTPSPPDPLGPSVKPHSRTAIIGHPPRRARTSVPRLAMIAILGALSLCLVLLVVVLWPRPVSAPKPYPVAVATLMVGSSPPGAEVRLNDVVRGHTPVSLALDPGPAHLELTQPGFATLDTTIHLRPGNQDFSLAMAAIPITYRVRILTRPGFAFIYVDGSTARLEPPLTVRLAEGSHSFRLVTREGLVRVLSHDIEHGDSVFTLKLDYDQGRAIQVDR